MQLYAVTESGFRRISSADDLQAGEYLWEGDIPFYPDSDRHALIIENGALRPANAAEILNFRRALRVAAMRAEAEPRIDAAIAPTTRSMLRDGVLSQADADAVRTFISASYAAVNAAAVQIAAADAEAVDTIQPAWPTFGGA